MLKPYYNAPLYYYYYLCCEANAECFKLFKDGLRGVKMWCIVVRQSINEIPDVFISKLKLN